MLARSAWWIVMREPRSTIFEPRSWLVSTERFAKPNRSKWPGIGLRIGRFPAKVFTTLNVTDNGPDGGMEARAMTSTQAPAALAKIYRYHQRPRDQEATP
jgi:hypothetical protein